MARRKEDIDTCKEKETLSPAEEYFCQLYICGGMSYAGQVCKCYKEAFGDDYKDVTAQARTLLHEPRITARIKELSEPMCSETEVAALKAQITETLRAVMEETATRNFSDKDGNILSPASLRAVSVNAAKALMELYPVKHIHETRLKIDGSENGIVFNVIVPAVSRSNEE